jgi:hypothetical protein
MPSTSSSTPRGDERDLRRNVQRDLRGGVQRDPGPHPGRVLLGDAVAEQEPPGLVGTVDLEALVGASVLLGQPEIVEQCADVEQLGVVAQPLLAAAQRAEQVDPPRVVED